eukprot:CAMPEP_0203940752 /NCGR_PEP_ID=MMETSP0359-20131031/77262_1 /ASSEMBLY_ACC=CAM_ASM_000338 /TAXON_ID=268821 /ORGANISM="Scrippsiella Hangoei, Strain SHTV-5" /LENGTH=56 /DNA_ID=CAMNT_0050871213 /DNA_START=20 /DNA_END=187 /DNA_ORIENTATION=-
MTVEHVMSRLNVQSLAAAPMQTSDHADIRTVTFTEERIDEGSDQPVTERKDDCIIH